MSKNARPVPTAVVAAGVIAALVIVISVIIVVQMTKRAPDSAGAEQAGNGPAAPVTQPADHGTESARTTWTEADEDSPTTGPDLTPAEQETQPGTGYAISGHVVDTEGHGVANASVQAYLTASIAGHQDTAATRVTTDEAGASRLADLPRRDLFLTASDGDRRFYLPSLPVQGRQVRCFPIPYLAGRDCVTNVRLILRQTTAISGKVVDLYNEPVANAVVTARDIGASAETDNQGCFRLAGLISDWCWLHAEARGYLAGSLILTPAGSDNVVLRLQRGVTVEGCAVLAESGVPVAGARIRAVAKHGRSSDEVDTTTADAEGRFEITAHPEYPTTLTARWESYVSDPEQVVEVSEERGWDPVTIELVKGGSIVGVVRDKRTELAAAGVSLEVKSPTGERMVAESDVEGAFSLDGLVPGPHVVSLRRYQLFEPAMEEAELRVEVVPGEAPAELELWVTPRPSVAGTVVNAEGEPIFGAVVVPNEEDDTGRTRLGQPSVTAADGRFLVAQYRRERRIVALVACHPDYCHTVVELALVEDPDADHDVRIVLEKGGGSIAGCVTGDDGAPTQHVRVDLLALDAKRTDKGQPPEVASTFTDETGRYRLDTVAAGTYRITATVYAHQFGSDEITLEAEQQLIDVDVTIPPSGHIAGRVTNTDDEPVAGITVSAYQGTAMTQTDADGRYRFDHLAQGREYRIDVYVRGTGYKGSYAVSRTVTCSADDGDFVLVPADTCTVRGFVYRRVDGSPVPQFKVEVWTTVYYASGGSHPSTKRYDFLTTDGAFECAGLEPGDMSITVTAPGFAEFTSEPFELKSGEEATRTVYLDAGATVRGAVYRKSDGSPITKYQLRLLPQDAENARNWHRQDWLWLHWHGKTIESENGSFECHDVSPGTYTIMIIADGLPEHTTEPFEIQADGETVQDVYLGEGGIVRGMVVDESGRPVADAVVYTLVVVYVKVGGESLTCHHSSIPAAPKGPSATTNSAGEFELRGLTLGEVRIRVTHPEYIEAWVRNIKVTDEAPTEDVVVKLERGAVLYGWIKDLDGNPVQKGKLYIHGSQAHIINLDENGKYRSPPLPKGEYSLHPVYLNAILPRFAFDGENDKELNIDFTKAGSISGKVNLPSQPEHVDVRVRLQGLDELNGTRITDAAGDGSFEFKGVFEGRYELSLSASSAIDRDTAYTVTTRPKNIVVKIGPREDVEQDITVIYLKESEPR